LATPGLALLTACVTVAAVRVRWNPLVWLAAAALIGALI
jgi:hypothetical protein